MTLITLKYFRNEGLWVEEEQADGTYVIKQEKLSQEEYEASIKSLEGIDELGNPVK